MNNDLIYGKDTIQRIVASEVKDNYLINYIAEGKKTITHKRPFYYYVLLEEYDNRRQDIGRLEGKNDLQYFVKFTDKQEMYQYTQELKRKNKNFWRCYNPVESAMLREGFTHFKGMTIDQVSILSFDIETTGVTLDDNSFVLLISNTFRTRGGTYIKRLFSFDDYDSPRDFINDWCKWVRSIDPDILTGHNIFGFDFGYLSHFAKLNKTKITLGRNASAIKIDRHTREFRKDGSQTYSYNNVHCFGREVIDTMFLAYKYDVSRKYESYGLKKIIKQEGLEKQNRQHWDFSKNKEPWNNQSDWTKFKQYAMDDADDALALFDLMAPQFFYYAQSIPKTFQEIINSATGSQVNAFMCRAYLQESKSIPMADENTDFEGAISIGNPGVYQNVYKVDVASLYPSIMLQYRITNDKKDPDQKFLQAVDFFTKQRLEDKRLANETGKRIYNDLSNGRKFMINSFYGFMGAPGLNFNYPDGAAEVTKRGRQILNDALAWATGSGHKIVNADTDSISFVPSDNKSMEYYLSEINSLYPDRIKWEDDGIYSGVVVVKAKNYALKRDGKVKIKGSALKATMKEPALVHLLDTALNCLLDGNTNAVKIEYNNLIKEIRDGITDISRWSSKKTITKAVLEPKRTNEQRVLDALQGKLVQEGDKVRMFFRTKTELCLEENFDGIYSTDTLYEKVFKTIKILEPVLNMDDFLNYKLVKNKKFLELL